MEGLSRILLVGTVPEFVRLNATNNKQAQTEQPVFVPL
jgi:hypothetical protein